MHLDLSGSVAICEKMRRPLGILVGNPGYPEVQSGRITWDACVTRWEMEGERCVKSEGEGKEGAERARALQRR